MKGWRVGKGKIQRVDGGVRGFNSCYYNHPLIVSVIYLWGIQGLTVNNINNVNNK